MRVVDSDLIAQLQNWYAAQCNGDWEHQYGIEISTLDNPGWRVSIDLTETYLEDTNFATVDGTERSEEDWVYCKVENKTFQGSGGIYNLAEILEIFYAWAIDESEAQGSSQ